MSYESYADKAGHQLGLIRGVRHASWEEPRPREIRFLVVLDQQDDDVRDMVIQFVDDFAREYVHDVGVEVCVMDAASAEHELSTKV